MEAVGVWCCAWCGRELSPTRYRSAAAQDGDGLWYCATDERNCLAMTTAVWAALLDAPQP
jgi:hypothetical protein